MFAPTKEHTSAEYISPTLAQCSSFAWHGCKSGPNWLSIICGHIRDLATNATTISAHQHDPLICLTKYTSRSFLLLHYVVS